MLKPVDIKQLNLNPFTTIGDEWMLVTAGDKEKYNMMTASWGGVGVMWRKNVSFIVIRPQRYTLEFLEDKEYYSLTFFDSKYKSALNYCGSHSGRDVNKEKETNLTPVFEEPAPYFSEGKLVLICRKMHKQVLEPSGFLDDTIDSQFYSQKDYHLCFVGEIVNVLIDE